MDIKMLASQKLHIALFCSCLILVVWGILRAMPPREIFEDSDKVAHFVAFAALSFTGRLALKQLSEVVFWPAMFSVAVALEYLQGQLQSSRYASIEDAIANATGVLVVLIFFVVVSRFKGKLAS